MIFKKRKQLAAKVLKCSPKRVKLDTAEMEDIKEALTKEDIRGLIHDGVIRSVQKKGVSRARANVKKQKKSRGQQSGPGSRRGKATARTPKKEKWMNTIRTQREFLKLLKEKKLISTKAYRELYLKSKGGFFRSRRHLKIYVNEHNLIQNEKNKG